jgi:hypothetical protein
MTKSIVTGLAFAAVVLGGAALLKWAEHGGMVTPETARQIVQISLGLVVAFYGNYVPKQIARRAFSPQAARRAQNALRFGGWSLTLAGLAYAALWALTPADFAGTASLIVLAGATAATMAYSLWAYASCRTAAASGA